MCFGLQATLYLHPRDPKVMTDEENDLNKFYICLNVMAKCTGFVLVLLCFCEYCDPCKIHMQKY